MKKFLSILLVAVMLTAVLAGCGDKKDEGKKEDGNTTSGEQEYKLGMGVSVSDGSKDATAQVDATAAVVITDASGKIVACYIDVAQNKMDVSAGTVTVGQEYRTKQEKKEDYGMKGVSEIGKEWYEQANFFADFVVGKTASDVSGIETQESGGHQIATDADILAGCTMDITAMTEAVVKACNDDQAKTFKASATPVLGFAAETEDSSSKDPSADEAGLAAMYTTFGATAVVDGKVAAAIVDTIQPKIGFGSAGEITDFNFGGTKRELKEDYGMKGVSGIEKEWYEQAEFFTNFVVGKTSSEISGIATEESNGHQVATDADILAGCTMDIAGYISVLTKSIK